MALLPNGRLPTGTIAALTTLMSEGDLRLLQWTVQDSYEELSPELVETAYNVAREMHPQVPSLRELMSFNHLSAPPPNPEPTTDLQLPS